MDFDLRALQRVFLDFLGRRPQQRKGHFCAGRSTQNIDRVLQIHSFGGNAVDSQDLVAGENARLGRRRVLHRSDHGRQAVFHRDLDPEAVETAARVVLHVAEIIRVHELAVWIQRGKHALHCRGDEIVIARLVLIHVILPEQFERLCENGNLRVAVILFTLSLAALPARTLGKSAEHETSQQRR